MQKGVKFRIYPNKEQQTIINQTLGCCRLIRHPQFKSKHNRHQSYRTINQGDNIRIVGKYIKLPKLGYVKVRQSMEVGKINNVTIEHTPTGKYFAVLNVDFEPQPMLNQGGSIGIDVGIKEFYSDSNENTVSNPKYLEKSMRKLIREQRKLSRKEKGSSNRNKQRIKVALVHEKITNQRNDFLQKQSTMLIRENQTICIEDLNVKNMMRNHKLAQHIGSASWTKFFDMLSYKARMVKRMYLEEMINAEYSRLNENDILIWQYIQLNKRECCEIAIEDLAQKCCISRTTISRFTQKLGFTGFREFKVHLKMEWEQEQVKTDVLLENVCDNYMKCIQMIKETDLEEVCSHIYHAKRLFAYGTGETQHAVTQMIKRMFMNVKRFFVTLYGKTELMMTIEDLSEEDMVIMISLSGENELAVQAAKKLKARGVYTLSITRLSDNTLARLCSKNLYIPTDVLMTKAGVTFETISPYFNVAELLCIRYLVYMKKQEEKKKEYRTEC